MPKLQPNPRPKRVLVVIAHPDDAEFMLGGTLAHWSTTGTQIHYLVVTDGNGGSRDPNQTPEQLAQVRRAEQRNAAHILGVADVTFLGYVDGRVAPTLALRLQIARAIRRVRPDVVVTQDPLFHYSPTYINHPDHRAVAEATLAAIMPMANTRLSAPELLAEGWEPHDVREVYFAAPVTPAVWMPLSWAELERKLEALRAHASQLGDSDPAETVRAWTMEAAGQAREHGVDCEFAEAFAYVQLQAPEEEQPPNVEPN
jgi:LmbE family N-acetylglucosaminyl deacetylase